MQHYLYTPAVAESLDPTGYQILLANINGTKDNQLP